MNKKLKQLNKLRDEVVDETLQSIDLNDSLEINLQKLRDIEDYLGVMYPIQRPYLEAFGDQLKQKVWQTDVLDKLANCSIDERSYKLAAQDHDRGFDVYHIYTDESTHDMSYYGLGHVVNLI
jgi:hypothetical protein